MTLLTIPVVYTQGRGQATALCRPPYRACRPRALVYQKQSTSADTGRGRLLCSSAGGRGSCWGLVERLADLNHEARRLESRVELVWRSPPFVTAQAAYSPLALGSSETVGGTEGIRLVLGVAIPSTKGESDMRADKADDRVYDQRFAYGQLARYFMVLECSLCRPPAPCRLGIRFWAWRVHSEFEPVRNHSTPLESEQNAPIILSFMTCYYIYSSCLAVQRCSPYNRKQSWLQQKRGVKG
jgi:hypothetical protein